jgi:Flp pilus assembly protein TadG
VTPAITSNTGRADRQAGSAALELTLLAMPLVVLLLLIAVFGRLSAARLELATVAGQAARAASVHHDQAAATVAAQQLARDALATGTKPTCRTLTVLVDLSRWYPGGTVTVTVSCRVDLADLAPPGTPRSRTLTATATAPIDVYRGLATGPVHAGPLTIPRGNGRTT